MKKIVSIVALICLFCATLCNFVACENLLNAQNMLKYCDSKLEDILATDDCVIDIEGDVYALAVHKIDGESITVDYVAHDQVTISANVTAEGRVEITQTCKEYVMVNLRCYMVVGIPKSWSSYSLYANFEAGSVSVEDLDLAYLSVDVNAGSCNVKCNASGSISASVKAGSCNVSGSAPKVYVTNNTGSINANVTSADVTLKNETGAISFDVKQATSIELENMAGAITGKIQGKQELFTIQTTVDFGKSNLENQQGDGMHTLTATNNAGGINITFYE